MKRPQILVSFIALCLLVGIFGGLATRHSLRDWYPLLIKPYWRPPDTVFGPVWTLLYITMGIAAWRVFLHRHQLRSKALKIFFAQLAINGAWSFLFFGLKSPFLGLLDIFFLIGFLIWTIFLFSKIDGIATWLLIPYLLWVCYAASLNVAIWWYN